MSCSPRCGPSSCGQVASGRSPGHKIVSQDGRCGEKLRRRGRAAPIDPAFLNLACLRRGSWSVKVPIKSLAELLEGDDRQRVFGGLADWQSALAEVELASSVPEHIR